MVSADPRSLEIVGTDPSLDLLGLLNFHLLFLLLDLDLVRRSGFLDCIVAALWPMSGCASRIWVAGCDSGLSEPYSPSSDGGLASFGFFVHALSA